MSAYQPTDRRPIAASLRRTADVAVRLCVRRRIHPDAVSYASAVAAAGAGACLWQSGVHLWLVIPAAVLMYLRLWLNMLDGMVALASGKASRRGEILNELPDRVSDVLIFVGVAHSGLCAVVSGYWAAVAALLVAYVGTLGQAIGARRQFGGVMAKPWRMVTLHAGTWTVLVLGAQTTYAGLTIVDWTCIIIVLGCAQTASVRLMRILRALRETGTSDH